MGPAAAAAFVRHGQIVLAEGDREDVVMPVDRIPLTRGGQVGFQIENSLAAVAAAWSLGVPLDTIRGRAESLAADIDKVPARFNVLEIEGVTVVLDYGHNVNAIAAVIDALKAFPHQRRSCVYSTAGDRRDEDMVRQGALLATAFDRVILYEDHYLRGRAPGEIVGLLRKGLEGGTSLSVSEGRGLRTKEIIEVVGADKAAETGLKMAQPGELLLLQADTVDGTVGWLRGYLAALVARTTPELVAAPAPAAARPIEPAAAVQPGETLSPA